MANECGVQLIELYGYLTGQLDSAERNKLKGHLNTGCASCKRQLGTVGGITTETGSEVTLANFDAG